MQVLIVETVGKPPAQTCTVLQWRTAVLKMYFIKQLWWKSLLFFHRGEDYSSENETRAQNPGENQVQAEESEMLTLSGKI